ncbi:hypothetical protein CHU98_g12050 [Xylaria longipes]|nr:hypothetical protein CHU98_g12050 [Xylaria longipes]
MIGTGASSVASAGMEAAWRRDWRGPPTGDQSNDVQAAKPLKQVLIYIGTYVERKSPIFEASHPANSHRQHHLTSSSTPQTVTMSTAELASSYAALILADDGVEITADKLQTLIKAAGVEEVEPIWTQLFAKALEGKDVKELLSAVGSGGGAAAGPAAGGAAAGGAAAADEPAAEEKEEEKEESDDDMGFGLFD